VNLQKPLSDVSHKEKLAPVLKETIGLLTVSFVDIGNENLPKDGMENLRVGKIFKEQQQEFSEKDEVKIIDWRTDVEWIKSGIYSVSKNNFEYAFACYNQAEKINSESSLLKSAWQDFYLKRGKYHEERGEKDIALEDLRMSLDLGSDEALELLRDKYAKNSDKAKHDAKPKFIVAVGKSTIRKKNFSKEYVSIDAGDIFINLSKGEYYDFPSHLEAQMDGIGSSLASKAINEKKNIVVELIGLNYDKEFKSLIELMLKIGYSVGVSQVNCDIKEAWKRNLSRGDDNISAAYTDGYHFKWFRDAGNNFLKLHGSKIAEEEFTLELGNLLSQLNIQASL
jgi:hypothetical protein